MGHNENNKIEIISDEGPETGEDSEDDLVRSYLPQDRYILDTNCEFSFAKSVSNYSFFSCCIRNFYLKSRQLYCMKFRLTQKTNINFQGSGSGSVYHVYYCTMKMLIKANKWKEGIITPTSISRGQHSTLCQSNCQEIIKKENVFLVI